MATSATTSKREIAILDSDWRWATWRKLPPPALPPKKPSTHFDKEKVLARLASKVRPLRQGVAWDFSRAELSPSMSKEEARLWLEAMLWIDKNTTPKQRAEQLAKKKSLEPITIDFVRRALAKTSREPAKEFAMTLLCLFSPLEIVDLLIDAKHQTNANDGGGIFRSFLEHVIPHLSNADKAMLRKDLAPKLSPYSFPTDHYDVPDGEFLLAALIGGLYDELLAVVEHWPDDKYLGEDWVDAYHVPQLIIFGLGSAELVDKHMRRLNLRLRETHYMRAWLAHTEYAGLDWAAKTVVESKNKESAAKLAEVLALVHAPENAGPMLEIATRSKAPKVGVEWMEQNVEHAAKGLVTVAAGRGALADAAASRLADLKRAGHADVIDRFVGKGASSSAGAQKVAAIEAKETKLTPMSSTPKWLETALSQAKALKPVNWLNVGVLPSLEVDGLDGKPGEGPKPSGGKKLGVDHVKALVSALAASTSDKPPHALVGAIREHAPEASRDPFAWRIFEEWLTAGAPSKEKWALMAVGHLGGDASALKLASLVRAWPGESQHARAVIGLDVLGTIGSDIALVQLSGIAQKVKFQALKRRAGECMEKIAKARKMTRDELEDRIVPDGGFGADGKRMLSFGSRSFEVVLGTQGAPMVKDAEGNRRADLPKPGKQDDAAAAARSIAEWKTLKKGLREATKIQIERLEQAMVKGRSWSAKDFDALLVRHPLMSHLVRTVVWGAWDGNTSKLSGTFRITEDGTAANEKDVAFKIPKAASIRIVHPLELDAATKAAWGNIFGDYEIIAPFPQLDRPVHAVDSKEKKLEDLGERFKGQEWGVSAFVGKLRRRGWIHGIPQDAGFVGDHHKPFFSAGVTAVLEHNGYPIGSLEYADPQKIEHLYFLSGTTEPGWNDKKRKRLKLAAVDAKAVSEVLYDLLL